MCDHRAAVPLNAHVHTDTWKYLHSLVLFSLQKLCMCDRTAIYTCSDCMITAVASSCRVDKEVQKERRFSERLSTEKAAVAPKT